MIDRPALEAALAGAKPGELLAAGLEITGRGAAAMAQAKDAPPSSMPELLDPDQAAQLCGVKKKWLLNATKGMVFRSDLGHRTVRFEKQGLSRWLRTALP